MEQLTLCGGRLRLTDAKEQVLHLKCKIRRGALGEHGKKTMRNVRPDRPHEPGTVACAGPLAVLQAVVRGIARFQGPSNPLVASGPEVD